MSGSLFSPSWYRVAALTPRIRSHAQILRHQYRGETWYVMRDLSSDRVHRFSPAGHLIIGLMDGRRTVQEIWDTGVERLADDAPTQDEMIGLLSQLHAADVLQSDVPPDAAEVFRRRQQFERRTRMSKWMSPMSWKIPLLDPERLLNRIVPVARMAFGVTGGLLWLAVVVPALVLAAVHWHDLSRNFLDRLLLPNHAIVLWLCFPVIKALHEMGHALAVKAFGGEVHEMGVMLLVFTPVPYVDASSASAFRSKWERIVVGAAGMLVELFLAALAMFVWVAAEAGVARSLAYNTMIIAGISTVLFNANPLLRYDGYYIFADLIEIPNLYNRSRQYLMYLAERYLFGRADAEAPPASAGERAWFVGHALASFTYRTMVLVGIMMFLIGRSFYLGMALALFALGGWVVGPIFKGARFLFSSPRLRRARVRAVSTTVGLAVAGVLVLFVVPVPSRSRAEGVIWVPEEALVRAGVDGFIQRVLVPSGTRVRAGDALVECDDPELRARGAVLVARERELKARYDEARPTDPVKAQVVGEELAYVRHELARVREQLVELVRVAKVPGMLEVPTPESLSGRFVKKGDLIGYVVDLDRLTVRTVVPQASIDQVRGNTHEVRERLAERLDDVRVAVVRREVPGASDKLPTPALGSEGGGAVAVDPRDSKGLTAAQRVFQFDLELPLPRPGVINLGGRVYVRFDHGWEPVGVQWYRQVRQIFLARFNV